MPKHNLIKQSFPFTTDPLKAAAFCRMFPYIPSHFLKARVTDTKYMFFLMKASKRSPFSLPQVLVEEIVLFPEQ